MYLKKTFMSQHLKPPSSTAGTAAVVTVTSSSSSFSMTDVLSELQLNLYSYIKKIDECVETSKSMNNFMLMSINRAIDFTKVRHGVSLKPKMDTFSLRDVIEIPLKCMRDMESKPVTIELLTIPSFLCTHIITDRQWFQENLLCLVSNAVKFSMKGTVTVKVFLWQPTNEDEEKKETYANLRKSKQIEYPFPSEATIDEEGPDTSRSQNQSQPNSSKYPLSMPLSMSMLSPAGQSQHQSYSPSKSGSPVKAGLGSPGKSLNYNNFSTTGGSGGGGVSSRSYAHSDSMGSSRRSSQLPGELGTAYNDFSHNCVSTPISENMVGGHSLSTKSISFDRERTSSSAKAMIQFYRSNSLDCTSDEKRFRGGSVDRINTNTTTRLGSMKSLGEGVSRKSTPGAMRTKVFSSLKASDPFHDHHIRIEVEDQGVGIPPEEMKDLFAPFRQAQRLTGGTGLGLFSLAKRIESLNGHYGAEPRADGEQGIKFWFYFPYQPDKAMSKVLDANKEAASSSLTVTPSQSSKSGYYSPTVKDPAGLVGSNSAGGSNSGSNTYKKSLDPITTEFNPVTDHGSIRERDTNNVIPFRTATYTSTTSASITQDGVSGGFVLSPPAGAGSSKPFEFKREDSVGSEDPSECMPKKPMNILIVDDSMLIIRVVTNLLIGDGHAVIAATNGVEAVDRWKEQIDLHDGQPFDVVLMDMQMAIMDGVEATRRIRALEADRMRMKLSPPTTSGNTATTATSTTTTTTTTTSKVTPDDDKEKDKDLNINQEIDLYQCILALSANLEKATIEKAFAVGVDDYMAKPFTLKLFYEKYDMMHECRRTRVMRVMSTLYTTTTNAMNANATVAMKSIKSSTSSTNNTQRNSLKDNFPPCSPSARSPPAPSLHLPLKSPSHAHEATPPSLKLRKLKSVWKPFKLHNENDVDDNDQDDEDDSKNDSHKIQSLNILIVDDAPVIRKGLTNLLKGHGHTVVGAGDGVQALEKLQEQHTRNFGLPFDVILMDMQMPVMDGLEATRRIRALETEKQKIIEQQQQQDVTSSGVSSHNKIDTNHQFILAFSANSDDDTIVKAYDAGVDDFMPKPFDIKILYDKLRLMREKRKTMSAAATASSSAANVNKRLLADGLGI